MVKPSGKNKGDPAQTEEKILAAATEVFHQKGFGGARMEEIAQAAGINKALLHYYFRSKQKLFDKVFHTSFAQLISKIMGIMVSPKPLEEKVYEISRFYHQLLQERPQLPLFVLHALQANGPGFLSELSANMPASPPQIIAQFFQQIQAEVDAGTIKPIDPRHLMVSLVAMCVFPFMLKPVLVFLMGMEHSDFAAFVDSRQEWVPEFVMNALKPN